MKRLRYTLTCLTALFMTVGLVGLYAQDITHPGSGSSNFTVTQGTTVMYFDNGGADCDGTGGEYTANADGTAVICPDVAGSVITIEFLEIDVETRFNTSSPCWDYLRLYDGNSTSASLLVEGCGEEGFANCSGFAGDGGDAGGVEGGSNDMDGSNDATPVNNVFTSTASNGCLTVNFDSDGSVQDGGWVAEVSASAVGSGPTCDDGIQNGDETGVDCGGSNCPPCGGGGGGGNGGGDDPVCQDYSLSLTFDDFASETSWQLEDDGGNVLFSGDDYGSADDLTTLTEDFCLDEGCYEFTIFDSFGDGICCSFGNGSYELTDSDGAVVASGGDFDSEESTVFCTDCTPPSATASVIDYCSNGVFMVAVTLTDLGSATTVTIENNAGVPALQNVFFPRTYYVGPFPIGTDVDIVISDTENPSCATTLSGLSSDCAASLIEIGNENISLTTAVSVFPNPTSGELNVNMTGLYGETVNIRIMNTIGQIIEQRQIDFADSATEQFDLSQQQSGMYIMQLSVEGGETYTKRVMLGDTRP